MFGFFKKKSDPVVDGLLAKIEELKKGTPDNLYDVAPPLFDSLANAVKTKWTPKNIEDYSGNIKNGESHEAFICNYLVHTCGDRLESGMHHVYRGVLSEEGNAYVQLLNYAINVMVNKCEYTEAWAQENLRGPIIRRVKEAG